MSPGKHFIKTKYLAKAPQSRDTQMFSGDITRIRLLKVRLLYTEVKDDAMIIWLIRLFELPYGFLAKVAEATTENREQGSGA